MWTEAVLAYLAGIIDGEGCLSMRQVGRSRFSTQIFIGNTDARMIEWLRTYFGGTVQFRARQKQTHKPLWMWISSSADVSPILTAVLPYLVLKKEQASLLIAYRETVNAVGANKAVLEAVNEQRHTIKTKLAILNRRGNHA